MNARTAIWLVSCAIGVAPAGAAAQTIPSADALREARAFTAEREGPARVSWAVIDTRGRLWTRHGARHHRSASQTKAMLLVAYLRGLGERRAVPPAMRRVLGPMIQVSGNRAAARVYRIVGDAGLADLGRRAGMRDLRLHGTWSGAEVTAADQARFFSRIDRLCPPRHRVYARRLLSTIVPRQSWGIPAVARPLGLRTFFKGGWRRGLMNQGALLEPPGGGRLSIAILVDRRPSFGHGRRTLEGLAARLLAGAGAQPALVTRSRPSRLET